MFNGGAKGKSLSGGLTSPLTLYINFPAKNKTNKYCFTVIVSNMCTVISSKKSEKHGKNTPYLTDSASTHKAYTKSCNEPLKSLVQKKQMQGLVEDVSKQSYFPIRKFNR